MEPELKQFLNKLEGYLQGLTTGIDSSGVSETIRGAGYQAAVRDIQNWLFIQKVLLIPAPDENPEQVES